LVQRDKEIEASHSPRGSALRPPVTQKVMQRATAQKKRLPKEAF